MTTKRVAETQSPSTKGRKVGIAPSAATQARKAAVVITSPKSVVKSKQLINEPAPANTKITAANVFKPTTPQPQRTVQFSSPALEVVNASSDAFPISTQRRAFLTAGVESSPSSATDIRPSVMDYVPSQNQLSARSSQIIIKPKFNSAQKRARESGSHVGSIKRSSKKQRRLEARVVEVESETEDRLSAALQDLFTVSSSFYRDCSWTELWTTVDDIKERRPD